MRWLRSVLTELTYQLPGWPFENRTQPSHRYSPAGQQKRAIITLGKLLVEPEKISHASGCADYIATNLEDLPVSSRERAVVLHLTEHHRPAQEFSASVANMSTCMPQKAVH